MGEKRSHVSGADDPLFSEQLAYYEARAPEYDEWIERRGRYDRGPELNAIWHEEMDHLRRTLAESGISGHALDLACGTGNWTRVLATCADRVTAIDASASMLAVNRRRLEDARLLDKVEYVQADLFAWRPDREYDGAVMGFILSHIPDDRLDEFLATVSSALRPGGRVFIADSRYEPASSPADSPPPTGDEIVTTRRLNDGRAFRIYKLFRSPREYEEAFARHGIKLEARETPRFFVYGCGEKLG